MIFFLRKLTKNFMLKNQERSINELPINIAPIVDGYDFSLEKYTEEIVM
jgi:hypothetical protein